VDNCSACGKCGKADSIRTTSHPSKGAKDGPPGVIHTNTVESTFSLLKRCVVGTWHKVGAKHLLAYLDEMCFRFNKRKSPYLFRDTLTKLINTLTFEYKELTATVKDRMRPDPAQLTCGYLAFALAVFLQVLPAAGKYQKYETNNEQPLIENPLGAVLTIVPLQSLLAAEPEEQESNAQSSHWYDWFWPPDWATWGLVLVGIWAGKIALETLDSLKGQIKDSTDQANRLIEEVRKQAVHTEKAANAAKEGADHAMLDNRAWVFGEQFTLEREPENIGDTIRIWTSLANSGKTPALNLVTSQVISVWNGEPDAINWDGKIRSHAIIVPPAAKGIKLSTDLSQPLTATQVAAYKGHTTNIYLDAIFWYKDISGKAHWTTARVRHAFGEPLTSFDFCATGNDTDDSH
jgi:hypothetical protein